MTAAPAVRLSQLGRRFPGPPPVDALRDATLMVRVGEHVAIMGPSGSGKSTLLNLIGLLDSASSGVYELDGVDVGGLTARRRTALRRDLIGFVFQDFFLLPARSAWENVALAMVYSGMSAAQRKRRALAALDRVGLSHRYDALPSTLSGGERQRVAIARALSHEPKLLLCDEPTGNLDSVTAGQVMDLIGGLNRLGVTVLTITHDLATAQRASRLLRIVDGRVTDQWNG
ncbi:MAG: ABC transporter ATP-binding protein [Propionibacteriaceae bacterium]|jgi:putative ABC transport system ATP-binding protein|nr:ABC transporter ATP-binding protein [Propionibacteriaceae bacterium]